LSSTVSVLATLLSDVSTTCRLVRIQPALSKMTPEPTPVSGTVPPSGSVVTPLAVMRTTAGLTFAAAVTTAEESSMATGAPLDCDSGPPLDAGPMGWFRAPVPSRTSTVPPDASTADSSAAPRIVPRPVEPRLGSRTGVAGPVGVTGSTAGSGSSEGDAHAGRCSGTGE
jgi:hypothetical protein